MEINERLRHDKSNASYIYCGRSVRNNYLSTYQSNRAKNNIWYLYNYKMTFKSAIKPDPISDRICISRHLIRWNRLNVIRNIEIVWTLGQPERL